MKFAHLSDIHIGGWREPKLRDLNLLAFLNAMNTCVEQRVDFILISGDLFNTSLPAIDKLNVVTHKLKDVKDRGICVYVIAGSHDFSSSGKTMIDVLESAGVFVNVCKGLVLDSRLRLRFTTDVKTGVKITGMMGKKGMLDRVYFDDLDRESLENEEGTKIFMFHTALIELKPKHLEQMEAYPLSLLPKGFFYYAGGHVHHRNECSSEGYRIVTQPGALFPNNFAELEKYGHGGFYIVDEVNVNWVPVQTKKVISRQFDCEGKAALEIVELVRMSFDSVDVHDAIITLRFTGAVKCKTSDIRFVDIFDHLYGKGAYFVMKNTSGLHSEEFEEIKISFASVEDIEAALIKEHSGQVSVGIEKEQEFMLVNELMHALSSEKKEGETVKDYENRIKLGTAKVLEQMKKPQVPEPLVRQI